MKKLFILLFVLSLCSIVFAANKDVVYDKDTSEIIGVMKQITNATESGRVDIQMENGMMIYGANPDKITTASVDESLIPADLKTTTYKIDAVTKDVYQDVIMEEIK